MNERDLAERVAKRKYGTAPSAVERLAAVTDEQKANSVRSRDVLVEELTAFFGRQPEIARGVRAALEPHLPS